MMSFKIKPNRKRLESADKQLAQQATHLLTAFESIIPPRTNCGIVVMAAAKLLGRGLSIHPDAAIRDKTIQNLFRDLSEYVQERKLNPQGPADGDGQGRLVMMAKADHLLEAFIGIIPDGEDCRIVLAAAMELLTQALASHDNQALIKSVIEDLPERMLAEIEAVQKAA